MVLGGNVQGVSTLALLKEVTPEYVAVLELDSWQLQGLGDAHLSPSVSIFTTFFPDHVNYYKDDPSAYLSDKSNIFLYQSPDDVLIIGKQVAPTLIDAYGENIVSKIIVADETKLPEDWKLKILGTHNRYNAALALATARTLNIDDSITRKALSSFSGVPGRLEFIREINGIQIYNDTTSTTPEATLVALASLDVQNIILIMGGADKELNMDALVSKLSSVKKVLLLSGTGTERIKNKIPDAQVYDSIEKAFHDAFASAESGDTILFSPAFASFGMFKNEFDRGDQFTTLVKSLAE